MCTSSSRMKIHLRGHAPSPVLKIHQSTATSHQPTCNPLAYNLVTGKTAYRSSHSIKWFNDAIQFKSIQFLQYLAATDNPLK